MAEANLRLAVPLFGVVDMERSLRFYADGLGFTVTRKWIDGGRLRWCWLERDDVAVMLQEYTSPDRIPASKLGAGVSLNFICRDALAVWRELRARGVECGRPFVGNGMWVTEVTCPDGYALVFESPTDVPEETVYDGDS